MTSTGDSVGGLVGRIDISSTESGTISGSYASGAVTGTINIGGLVGTTSISGSGTSTISGSYASGAVTGTSTSIGGLVGVITINDDTATSTISASYASGNVEGTGTSTNIGGLIGDTFGFSATRSFIATSYWIDEESGSTPPRRVFGIGEGDDLTGTPITDHNNAEDPGETDTLDAQGLTIAQMRASSGTFPDFRTVSQILPTITNPPTVDFSTVWDYTAGCFPRLKQWVDTDGDGVIDANEPIGELLPGQEGACNP